MTEGNSEIMAAKHKKHVCEEPGCTETNTGEYTWPMVKLGERETIVLCHDHAIENGFCVWCMHFGAGSEEYDFSPMRGYHRDCYDELRYEVGDYDEEDEDEYGDYDFYPADWYRAGSAESELEPEETPREIYIGPGSENAAAETESEDE